MKYLSTILCLILAVGFTQVTQAQLIKGDNIISGTFNLSTQSSSESVGGSVQNGPKFVDLNIAVGGMKIINEAAGPGAFGLGMRLSFQNTVETTSQGSVTQTRSKPIFEIAPFARSYFTNATRFGVFAEGIVGLSLGTSKLVEEGPGGTNSAEEPITGFSILTRPGFSYFVTDKVGLEFMVGSLGYNSTTTKHSSNSTSTESDFGIRFDLSTVQVGVSLKI